MELNKDFAIHIVYFTKDKSLIVYDNVDYSQTYKPCEQLADITTAITLYLLDKERNDGTKQ